MKKLLMAAAALTLTVTMTVLTSCTNDIQDNPVPVPVPEPEPETLSEYTIIYYGQGGGNLDKIFMSMINEVYKAGPEVFKRVNVVGQFKFSTKEHLMAQGYEEDYSDYYGCKTIRWIVDPSKDVYQQFSDGDNLYDSGNADCTCPDSLTNFIDWAVKVRPAKKYMLIMNSHGGGYRPNDDMPEAAPATRGLIFDDGYDNKHFSVKSLHRAIAAANVRFETIYMWACLMNNLEYQFELQDLCDYVIASTYSMPAAGGVFNVLAEQLSLVPSVDIERALDTFCKADVESWDRAYAEAGATDNDPIYTDMTVTRTANIAHLGEVLREFTDRLCDTYANGTDAQRQAIDSCTARTVKVELTRPNYDGVKYVRSLIDALPEVYGDNFYNQMKDAFNNCIVAQYFSKYLTNHDYMVDYSIMLGASGAYSLAFWEKDEATGTKVPLGEYVYTDDGALYAFKLVPTDDAQYYRREAYGDPKTWESTLADTYEQLTFDRAVGWSRWLRLNEQWPNLFCPKDLFFELPMPEDN